MVTTPWGDSDSLRERRLRPGPGSRARRSVANQRERLFGGDGRRVAERGYAATHGRRPGRDLGGLEPHLLRPLRRQARPASWPTLEAMIEAAIAYATRRAERGAAGPGGVRLPRAGRASWEERARPRIRLLRRDGRRPAGGGADGADRGLRGRAGGAGAAGAGGRRLRMADPADARAVARARPGCRRRWSPPTSAPSRKSPGPACWQGREARAAGADRRALGADALLPAAARAAAAARTRPPTAAGRKASRPTTTPSGRCAPSRGRRREGLREHDDRRGPEAGADVGDDLLRALPRQGGRDAGGDRQRRRADWWRRCCRPCARAPRLGAGRAGRASARCFNFLASRPALARLVDGRGLRGRAARRSGTGRRRCCRCGR